MKRGAKVLRSATPTERDFQRNETRLLNISRMIGTVSMTPAERKARAAFKKLSAGTGKNRPIWQLRSKP